MTLAVFAFLPIIAVFSVYFNTRVHRAFKINRERIGDVNAQVEDNLAGIRVVKSFANEDAEQEKFAYENQRFLESRKDIYRTEAYFTGGGGALTQLMTVAVVVVGGASIVRAALDLADLITFMLYLANLVEPIQRFIHVANQYQEGITGFERFLEILEVEPDVQDAPDAVELAHVLCSLIPRFYDVSEGEVLLDGIDVRDIKLSSLRRNIGVVQQDVYLFAGTVLDNIRYGKPDASREEIVAAAIKANAHAFIMALPAGYDTDIGQRGVKLSGGQKQRLSIARVFLKDPPVLIFDEATSALDNESEQVIRDSLERLARNRTTFVIAHRLSTIRNAKRVVVLTDRGIDEQGTHEELMGSDGAYAHLYHMQFSR